ncbi:hypothetical protein GP484_13915 [Mammaliicoccus sciuri]|uniref:hypothetical protein n=1 Tax=Mammaliicoccus sciuri TaxID=1296 RepID=UPI0019549B74|nr:hypothetical protein [Mammaliicoccus sciuri]MCD3220963.1 hypothetical protein [Mammaliicoccus sciuri]
MINKKEVDATNVSFGFGLGVVFIVASILTFYFYSDLILRIFCAFFVLIGFFGIGTEFEKLNMRGPYKMAIGFSFIILAFWGWEYYSWLFIIGISLSSGIFFSALAEYLMTSGKSEKKTNKGVTKIEGVLSIIGSLCSIISFIIPFLIL